MTKVCSKCGVEKDIEEFNSNKDGLYGKSSRCKSCLADIQREYKLRKRFPDGNVPDGAVKRVLVASKEGYKICCHCKQEKPITEFAKNGRTKTGVGANCIPCQHELDSLRYQNNIVRDKARKRIYKTENREVYLAQRRAEYERRKDKQKQYREAHKEQIAERTRKYREAHPEKFREYHKQAKEEYGPELLARRRELRKKRYTEDIGYRLETLQRGRILAALDGRSKSAKTIELLGCTPDFLKAYLEAMFVEGMNWDNINIDHIKPCAKFDMTDPIQQRLCFNYRNLQPLFPLDNQKKHDRWSKEDEVEWLIKMQPLIEELNAEQSTPVSA